MITKNTHKKQLFKLVDSLAKNQFSHFTKVQNPASLINETLKKEFEKKVQNIDNNSAEKNIIQKDIVDYIDSKKRFESDLTKIPLPLAQKAVEKIFNNETPSKKEFTAFSDIKNEYNAFFDDSENESGSESDSNNEKTKITKQNQLEKLNDIETYIQSDYEATVTSLNRLKKVFSKLSVGSSVEKETRKRKMEESSDEDSSKRSRQTVHDFVENIPIDFNPLDDIGND